MQQHPFTLAMTRKETSLGLYLIVVVVFRSHYKPKSRQTNQALIQSPLSLYALLFGKRAPPPNRKASIRSIDAVWFFLHVPILV